MTSRLIAYHIERLKNKDPEVRMKAIEELRLIGHPEALAALEEVFQAAIEKLKNKDVEARLTAIEELRLLGSSHALAVLEKVYHNDEHPEVRKAARQAGRDIYNRINETSS